MLWIAVPDSAAPVYAWMLLFYINIPDQQVQLGPLHYHESVTEKNSQAQ